MTYLNEEGPDDSLKPFDLGYEFAIGFIDGRDYSEISKITKGD